MSSTPTFEMPEPQAAPPKRSNTTLWIVIILAIGGLCLVALPILAAILFPVFSQAREAAKKTACLSNEKRLALANILYSEENNGRFPLAKEWQTRTEPLVESDKPIQCPTSQTFGYGFNEALSDFDNTSIEEVAKTVLLFETNLLGPNAFGGELLVVRPGRHFGAGGKGNNFGFADGHVKFYGENQSPGSWQP